MFCKLNLSSKYACLRNQIKILTQEYDWDVKPTLDANFFSIAYKDQYFRVGERSFGIKQILSAPNGLGKQI